MRILICGSREFNNVVTVAMVINAIKINDTIIQGDCVGADLLAKNLAILKKITVESYPANWQKYGKRAGIIRSIEMLDSGIDRVYAFYWRKKTKGTSFTVHEAIKRGIEVIEIIENN